MWNIRDQFGFKTLALHPLIDRFWHSLADAVDRLSMTFEIKHHLWGIDLVCQIAFCNPFPAVFQLFHLDCCADDHDRDHSSFDQPDKKQDLKIILQDQDAEKFKDHQYRQYDDNAPEKFDILPYHAEKLIDRCKHFIEQCISPPFSPLDTDRCT